MALRDWLPGRKRAVPKDRALADTFRRALLAVLEGDLERAETLITAAVKADSDDIEPYRSLACLFRARGELGRAIRIHQNLLLRSDLPEEQRDAVLLELADDFREGGFTKRAIASYEEALAHRPKSAAALRALRDLYAETGEPAKALEHARRLGRVEGRDVAGESHLQARLARSEHDEGRHDAARKAAKRALRRDPENAEARFLLGELEAERGRNKAALAAWRELATRGGERSEEALERLESSFSAVGRGESYETFLRGILEERPDDSAARRALAGVLARKGEADRAALELRRAFDVNPRDWKARLALGTLLLDENRDADALKEYRELLAWLESNSLGAPGGPDAPGGRDGAGGEDA